MRMDIAVFSLKEVFVMAKSLSERYLNKYRIKQARSQKRKLDSLAIYERYQFVMATANRNADKNGIWTAKDRKRVQTWKAKLNKKLGIEE